MQPEHELPVVADTAGSIPISPTDISQFIRLDQCERYLRLRLHERTANNKFMVAAGVVPQSIPPLLTRSGEEFEQVVEGAVGASLPNVHFNSAVGKAGKRTVDNEEVVACARDLEAGQVLVLFQPRIEATIGSWRLRGDIDVLRLERTADGRLHVLLADMKSSTSAKVEHRLQVAFYHEMLAELFAQAGVVYAQINLAILYRGPAPGVGHLSTEDEAQQAA